MGSVGFCWLEMLSGSVGFLVATNGPVGFLVARNGEHKYPVSVLLLEADHRMLMRSMLFFYTRR